MAPTLRKAISHYILIRYYSSVFGVASSSNNIALKLSSNKSYALKYMTSKLYFSYECDKHSENWCSKPLSANIKPERLCWEGSSRAVLLRRFEIALMHHKLDEAWDTYKDFKRLYGFPDHSLVSRLVTELSYSSDSKWLRKASNLVISIQKDKFGLLRPDLMTKLSLSLARAQMPIRASAVLRQMLLKRRLPPSNILEMIFLHLVKTKTGMVLASNVLVELCDMFQQFSTNKAACMKCTKPDTVIFNLVLDACARFGSSFKGQSIIELMAQVGVIADAQTIGIISLIYEKNGMRDELNKFKEHIDKVSTYKPMCHYQQFYESLLSLHFKFDDIDAAFELLLDMYRPLVSAQISDDRMEPVKPCLIPLGSHHLRMGLTLRVLPDLLKQDTVVNVGCNHRFITCKDGRLVLSSKALAKLMLHYKRCGRISELSKLLSRIQKASPCSSNILHDVVDACICLGWLETAHDILDDLEMEGNRLSSSSYMSLFAAYHNLKMFREADVVLKQMGKAGGLSNAAEQMVSASMSEIENEGTYDLKKLTSTGKSDLTDFIAREMREEEKEAPSVVYNFNSSIYFFMKAQMIGDARRAYRKMQKMKIQPTVSTFINLVHGYSSMGMYREITILWGDIKRNIENGIQLRDSDLYELLLLNFLRGGYFERVMEIIGLMKEISMYLDKWIYKYEFLKLHKDLYRHMKVFDARNEVQKKRIEYVEEFKKWAGMD
ncbi:pentatricopeptide repeat-containing protein At4g17616 [Ipomoea triloba]|uniref:pentatricopeptide repeat-containing protein At4g17616 n=1 Tax=Ipomoea triloba TaxID=35885 RepID=UPI00125DFA2B|nr:pentatricopeptide repeat-containing protein At4g17616 [Ipomoea triloba]XP_031114848.1 pentatricopeptide repeat-containing protein At4g17616 [Ipomoea triloba]